MAGQPRAAVDQRNHPKPRLIGGVRLGARGFRLCRAPDRAVGGHRPTIEINRNPWLAERRRRYLEPPAQHRCDAQIALQIFRVDVQRAGGIGEADVVDADVRLRQHHEHAMALRNGDEPRGLPDLRQNFLPQNIG